MTVSAMKPWALVLLFLALAASGGCPVAASDAVEKGAGQVDRARLLNADTEPGNWFTTGRDFGEQHYSPLDSISRNNVGKLGQAWEYETFTQRGLEATPIVVDGVMYTSGPFGKAYAIDARTGEEIWYFDAHIDGQVMRGTCCDAVSRGVAVWKGKVYVGATDGRLFALDAATGKQLWVADTITDHKRGYSITGAPRIAGNVVVIGNGGAEYDARGYISAYDLDTGKLVWRFFTVPGDPALGFEHPELEMAAKTWDPHSRWNLGLGGTVWDSIVYDPELDLLYVGTGNAALYNRSERSPSGGDNLFLSSILALRPETGRMVWYYQEVPGDMWDFTATQPMVMADLKIGGKLRKVLMQAPKDGFFYVLDRETGELISAKNFMPQNWAKSLDPETGHATVDREKVDYSDGVKLIFPSAIGAHSWHPMAFSRDTGLVYIPAMHGGNYMYDPTRGHTYRPGLSNSGMKSLLSGTTDFSHLSLPADLKKTLMSGELLKGAPDPEMYGMLIAWDPVRQKQVWGYRTSGPMDRAGVLATGGGLVVSGSITGKLRFFDDRTGKLLREIETGSSIVAAPMTYTVDGEQYISVMAALGGGIFTQSPPPDSATYKYGNMGRILTFKLGGGPVSVPDPLPPVGPVPKPPRQTASAEVIAHGDDLFHSYCAACHLNSPRGYPPDLTRLSKATHEDFMNIVHDGARRLRGMPQWDDLLSREDVKAIHAYLISISQAAYDAQGDVSDHE